MVLDSFDELSTLFFGQAGVQAELKPAVAEFFFPRYLKGDTWVNLREKMYPAFLDVLCDLIPDRQRIIFINQWLYQDCMQDHITSSNELVCRTEDTFGLKDKFIDILSLILDRARTNDGHVTSDCIQGLIQQHFPSLAKLLRKMFPNGETFKSGKLSYPRIVSNLTYLEV